MLLIEILRSGERWETGDEEADNLWHGDNDALRQVTKAEVTESLLSEAPS